MTCAFFLNIKKEKSRLTLIEDGAVLAVREWPEARDMGRQLFAAIGALLAERGLEPGEIADFSVQSDLPDTCTSARIAETVARVYTFGVSENNPGSDRTSAGGREHQVDAMVPPRG